MLLRAKDREALIAIFSTLRCPAEVWAFGSRVTGEAHEGSDLDLVIRTKNLQKLPKDVLLEIKEHIQKSNIPILVEIFDWALLPDGFHTHILNQYELLFSNLEEVGVVNE